jgi:hypothetical protein
LAGVTAASNGVGTASADDHRVGRRMAVLCIIIVVIVVDEITAADDDVAIFSDDVDDRAERSTTSN